MVTERITGRKDFKVGLIGRHLLHSYSPQIHELLSDYQYSLKELEPEQLDSFMRNSELNAFNVTIPYKLDVIPYMNHMSDYAYAIGSVNTVKRVGDELYGYNTDGYGFMYLLKRSGIEPKDKKAIVLGSGGASHTAVAMLEMSGAKSVTVISRGGENNYENLERHFDAEIIVNTTPVGMYPDCLSSPISLSCFKDLYAVVDLIYNPCRTKLLCDAEKRGALNSNGLPMLAAQAKRACEIFLDVEIDVGVTERIISKVGFQMENIVLIGMPGSGKTTVGKAIARLTGREFIDTDKLIEDRAKMTIPEIFDCVGEEGFREKEHEAVVSAGSKSGCVIATGGGAITREDNYFPLHSNGTLVFLKSHISSLSVQGRPLSQKQGVESLYRERLPFYERFADVSVERADNADITAQNIIKELSR